MEAQKNVTVRLFLLAWFVVALAIGLSGRFFYASAQLVAATVWGLTILTLIFCWKVPAVRSFALALPAEHVLAFHLVRCVGLALIYLYLEGRLPRSFGLIGGAGDCLVAVSAAVLILVPGWQRKTTIPAWNAVGLADIVGVVFSAMREGLRDPHSMEPLRQFPLDLLPLFFVPLIIASHLLIFYKWQGHSTKSKLPVL